MAIDVNARLSNIETNISAVSNYVNRLVTIYSGGGVQNPDLATLKAELQAWVENKGYVTLTGDADISGNKRFITQIKNVSKDSSSSPDGFGIYELRRSLNDLTDSSITNIGNNPGIRLYYNKDSIQEVQGLWFETAKHEDISYLGPTLYCRTNIDSNTYLGTYTQLSLRYDYINNYSYASAPVVSASNLRDSTVLTHGTVNSGSYPVVHKNGDEAIYGVKSFHDSIFIKDSHVLICKSAETRQEILDSTTYINRVGGFQHYTMDEKTVGVVLSQFSSNKNSSIAVRIFNVGQYNTGINAPNVEYRIGYDNATGASYSYSTAETFGANTLVPRSTTATVGTSVNKWDSVWANTGTIQTSDENLKQEISGIPEAVFRAWGKVKFQQFKFKDAVAKKGNNARIHVGVIAQRIAEAFQSEGLDARRYGLFCWDEWNDQYEDVEVLIKPEVRGQIKVVDAQPLYDEIIKEDGTVEKVLVTPERSHMEEGVIEEAQYRTERRLVHAKGSSYSVRYEECLALECAYQRWRLEQLEARLG